MTKLIISILAVLLAYAPVSAQLVEMVFGPLEGDSSGILFADFDQTIDVDLWIRTAPGISIIGFHIPMSSRDEYIRSNSREGGELCELLYTWDGADFWDSNPDPIGGYTSQSFVGIESFIETDCYNGIWTEGEWWWIASFRMTTVSSGPTGIPLCNTFKEGYEPYNYYTSLGYCLDGVIFGEIDPAEIILNYACLWFNAIACSEYTVGDYNGSGAFNVADIIDSYSRLKTGLPEPASICECPPESGEFWAVATDVNNSCAFNVADIVDGYSFLKTGSPEPSPCELCPPGEP
jgi:hypothetical protein